MLSTKQPVAPEDWREIKTFFPKPSCQMESAEIFQMEFLWRLKIKDMLVWVGQQNQISNKAKRHGHFV